MANNILDKISEADLKYLKEHFPEEVKTLEKSNVSDLSSKNLSSEVTSVVQKNDATIQLESKSQLTQEQVLNPEPPDTRSQVEKVVDRLHDNPKELAAELDKLAKNNPNMGQELSAAMEKHPGLAQDLPQLQISPPRWTQPAVEPQATQEQAPTVAQSSP